MHTNKIDISNRSIIRVILWILFFYGLYYFRSIVFVLFLSVIIASVVDRVVNLLKRFKFPRILSVVIFYLVSLGLVFLLFYFFLPTAIEYIGSTIKKLPDFLNNLDSIKYSSIKFLDSNKLSAFSSFANNLDTSELANIAQSKILSTGGIIASTSSLIDFLVNFVLTLVISFYISINEKGVHNFLRLVSPRKYENYIEDLVARSQIKISNWFIGQIVSAFFVAIMVYITLLILGIPFALSISILAFIFELMPILGIVSASIPALFLAWNIGGLSLMIITLVCFFIISQISSYFIYPKIVGKLAGIPPIMIIVSVIMGAMVAGFWGALIAIPVSTIIMEILDDYRKKKENEQFILY
ncbi:MAG: AI-2E family transporter [Candidatus Paceibacterota bacterium]|jgi:predicted PurR-regulated permease PerM